MLIDGLNRVSGTNLSKTSVLLFRYMLSLLVFWATVLFACPDLHSLSLMRACDTFQRTKHANNHDKPIVGSKVQKSKPMLDAVTLSDGRNVCFETWKTSPPKAWGEHRLSPTLVHLKVYVRSRCKELFIFTREAPIQVPRTSIPKHWHVLRTSEEDF